MTVGMKDNIYTQIDKHAYISFDVFDTLLLRPFVIPSDIFDYIEYKYYLPGYAKARKNVTVENGIIEKSIEDIYRNIGDAFQDCMDVELKEEADLIYANESLKRIFDYAVKAGKHIIIISDIYFHAFFIEKLLNKNGYSGYSKVYSSCDCQKTKCNGDLYDYVFEDLQIRNTELLHIGDNEVSDYAVPKSKNIDAVLVKQNFQKYCDYRQYLCGFHGSFQESFINKICADNFSNFEYGGGYFRTGLLLV